MTFRVMVVMVSPDHEFIRDREAEAFEFCSSFLASVGMNYLRERLDYDIRSQFGNFRVLVGLWFKIFQGDHVRLIEFYEDVYGDLEIPRHEALIEVFLVTLAATILGEEYKARRRGVGRALLNLRQKCRISLEYLFDMDALKYLEVNQSINHTQYLELSEQVRRKLVQKRPLPKKITSEVKPYYRKYHMSSSADICKALQKRLNSKSKQTSAHRKGRYLKNVITLNGLHVSKGVVSGTMRIVRNYEDIARIRKVRLEYSISPLHRVTSVLCFDVLV